MPVASAQVASMAPRHEPEAEAAPPDPAQARADADKALAELEAELFAAAKQVDRDDSIPHAEHADDAHADHPDGDEAQAPPLEPAATVTHDSLEADLQKELAALSSTNA